MFETILDWSIVLFFILTGVFIVLYTTAWVIWSVYKRIKYTDEKGWWECVHCGEAEPQMYKTEGKFFSYHICGKRECFLKEWNKQDEIPTVTYKWNKD